MQKQHHKKHQKQLQRYPKKQQKAETATVATPVAAATISNTTGRLHISPLARKMADDKGIALNQLVGSGENGRIIKRDVENFTPAAASSAVGAAKFVPTGQEDFEEIKNSQMRKTIAKRLGESKILCTSLLFECRV